MVEITYNKNIQVNEEKEFDVCYHLISENGIYSVECFVEHSVEKNPMTYCFIHNFTKDKAEAVKFVETLANGEVLPIHVKDIYEDQLT